MVHFELAKAGKFPQSRPAREWIRALYEAEVRYVDEAVGKVLDALRQLKIYDDSLIVLTSDHGEELFEHNKLSHGHSLFNEMLAVPLIVKLPDSPIRREVEQVVSLDAIMPTLLDLTGSRFEGEMTGESLSHTWELEESVADRAPAFSTGLHRQDVCDAVILDDVKYITCPESERKEMYDLSKDPYEEDDIAAVSDEQVQKMEDLIRAYRAQCSRIRSEYNPGEAEFEQDERILEILRSLGYIR